MTQPNGDSDNPRWTALRIFGAMGVALALLTHAGTAARARTPCATHTEITEQLQREFAERRVAIALAGNGGLVEVFSSGDGSTWTVIMTAPHGRSCIVLSGEAWQELRQVAQDPRA